MKQGIVLRAVLAVGAAAGVVAISACSPTSSGAPAPSRSATITQASTTQPVAPSTQANPAAAPITTAPAKAAPKVVSALEPANINFPTCGGPTTSGKSGVEPAGIGFSCDSQLSMQDAHWTSWNSSSAEGTATLVEDDCTPACANGNMAHNKVKVRFEKPVQASCGEFYTEAVFTYIGKPVGVPDYKPTWTYSPATPSTLC